jgi:hypothetical protein
MVVLRCPLCCMTTSNPDSLSSSETGLNPGIRSWKMHLSEWARCQKAVGGIYFTTKWRAETLQPGLECDNFKPRLKRGIFNCISWLNGSVFEGDDQGFLKEGVKTYQMATMSPFNSPTFFMYPFNVNNEWFRGFLWNNVWVPVTVPNRNFIFNWLY